MRIRTPEDWEELERTTAAKLAVVSTVGLLWLVTYCLAAYLVLSRHFGR